MRTMLMASTLVLLGGIAHADDVDTPDTRRAAASRYVEASDTGSLAQTVEAISTSIPLKNKEALLRVLNDKAMVKRLKELELSLLVKHYTTQELDAMADYYSSPLGRSATAKTEAYVTELMPALMGDLLPALQQAIAKPEAKQ